MEYFEKLRKKRLTVILTATVIVCLLVGGVSGYAIRSFVVSVSISDLQQRILDLENNVSSLQTAQSVVYGNNTYVLGGNFSLSSVYERIENSVVVIQAVTAEYDIFGRLRGYAQVQGSGFVYNFSGRNVVVTNYHVIQDAVNVTLTFADGDAYSVAVLGTDPYEDLAVVTTDAPQSEWSPVLIAHSSELQVGDPVIAVGSPYGLAGSMTTGIVSALGRTISEEMTGSYLIADIIQTSTAINPGNSGGPLLNYDGDVVGITTAIVSDSQGLGFAIPSDTILREISSLVNEGSYDKHPSLDADVTDMTFDIAKAMNVNVTCGALVISVSGQTGLMGGTSRVLILGDWVTVGGDIIVGISGSRITNVDDLSTYLERNTLPGQTIDATIVRDGQSLTVVVTLGTRPQPSG